MSSAKGFAQGLRDSLELVILDPSTCVRKGLCPVTSIRQQGTPLESHSLYFEQHGTGPIKIVFIMGLNSSAFSWFVQVKHFGRLDDYSVLVFDNRGVGFSGAPKGPYTTTGLAQDTRVLLDYVQWTADRDIHVVGLSLGGMIAQELACIIPERIASLTLGVTTPGGYPWSNLPPWKGLFSLARLTFMSNPGLKIPIILSMVYPESWLQQVAEDDPNGRMNNGKTNREVQTEMYRIRLQATQPQTLMGALSQMAAGLTHYVSSERLRVISESIPKVLILTGDEDNLVDPRNSRAIKQCMPKAELVEWKQTGHAIQLQKAAEFHELLKRVSAEGIERVKEKVDNAAP